MLLLLYLTCSQGRKGPKLINRPSPRFLSSILGYSAHMLCRDWCLRSRKMPEISTWCVRPIFPKQSVQQMHRRPFKDKCDKHTGWTREYEELSGHSRPVFLWICDRNIGPSSGWKLARTCPVRLACWSLCWPAGPSVPEPQLDFPGLKSLPDSCENQAIWTTRRGGYAGLVQFCVLGLSTIGEWFSCRARHSSEWYLPFREKRATDFTDAIDSRTTLLWHVCLLGLAEIVAELVTFYDMNVPGGRYRNAWYPKATSMLYALFWIEALVLTLAKKI